MPYLGNTPSTSFATVVKDSFSGDGSETAFTLSKVATTNSVSVFVENVRQEPTTAYAVSGTTLTFTAAPVTSSGNNIYVLHMNPTTTTTHPAAQALTATTGTFTSTVDVNGNELILDADADTSITADTDDQIDIKIAGADDFQFTANTFTAQSGSTIAAQALTATTITASGIVKTDDATDATTTTDGSLQTDGGLSVAKDAVIGDDVRLKSDAAVLALGADGDVTLTHEADAGLLMNTTLRDTRAVFGVNNNSNANVSLSANDTLATITFNTTDFDVGSNVKSGNNSIFVAPVAGMYRVTGRILVQGLNSDTAYSVNLYIATRPSGGSISYPFSTNMRGNFYSGGAQYMEVNGVVAVASGTDIFLRASFPNVSNIVYYASSSACNFFVNYIGNRNNGGT